MRTGGRRERASGRCWTVSLANTNGEVGSSQEAAATLLHKDGSNDMRGSKIRRRPLTVAAHGKRRHNNKCENK